MRSRYLRGEDTITVEQPASRGDGRHCSLCRTGICGAQPQVDQLATPKGAAGHCTLGYLRALRSMIATHGSPLSLYRDRHSIFQRNDAHWTLAEQLAGKQTPTQLGRALDQLGIAQ